MRTVVQPFDGHRPSPPMRMGSGRLRAFEPGPVSAPWRPAATALSARAPAAPASKQAPSARPLSLAPARPRAPLGLCQALRLPGSSPSGGQVLWRRSIATSAAAAAAAADSSNNGGNELPSDGSTDTVTSSYDKRAKTVRHAMDNKFIWSLVLQQKKHLFVAGVTLVMATSCNLASPVIVGTIVESLAGQQPIEVYQKYLLLLGVLYCLEPLLSKLYVLNLCKAAEKVSAAMRKELFRCLLMQKIEFFDRHKTSELTSLLAKELDSIRSFVFNNSSRDRGIRAFLETVGAVIVLICLSWQLGPLLAAVILSAGVGAAYYKRTTKPLEASARDARIGMDAVAGDAFRAIRTVRSFAGESLERERFDDHCDDARRAGVGFANAKSSLEAVNRFAIHASLLVLYSLGGWLIANGYMTLKTLLAGIGFTFSLIFASQGVVNSLSELRLMQSSLQRVRDVLNGAVPDPSMMQALPPGAWWDQDLNSWDYNSQYSGDEHEAAEAAATGSLELRDVTFSYPARREAGNVLESLSLKLEPGTVTAIVGRSGSGKSTIAALFSKFYKPDKGGVYLADKSVNEYGAAAWSNAIALVGQEPVLFDGTIFDNIAYGKRGLCTREEAIKAAELANADEFIRALPDGYDTVVGQGGGMLSGGQRQRIAIARAFCKDSPILILDEATSALDSESESLVRQAIERLQAGKTVMVIAHRLSTVQKADKICVIDDGKLVEQGTHEELLSQEGTYASLVNAQTMILNSTIVSGPAA